jgi:hypothetical protein
MSTQAAQTSITASIVVAAPIDRAFSVFTKDFGRFKPPEHKLLQSTSPRRCSSPASAGTC